MGIAVKAFSNLKRVTKFHSQDCGHFGGDREAQVFSKMNRPAVFSVSRFRKGVIGGWHGKTRPLPTDLSLPCNFPAVGTNARSDPANAPKRCDNVTGLSPSALPEGDAR